MCRTLNENNEKELDPQFLIYIYYIPCDCLSSSGIHSVFSVNGAGVKRYFKSHESFKKIIKNKKTEIFEVLYDSCARMRSHSITPKGPGCLIRSIIHEASLFVPSQTVPLTPPLPHTHARAAFRTGQPRTRRDLRRAAPAGPRFGPAFRRIPSSSEGMR